MRKDNHDLVAADVSKQRLCVLIAGQLKDIRNTPKGLAHLRRKLRGLNQPWVFCEATGGYERALVQMLHDASILVTVINPALIRHFAKSEGMKAKTDPIDTDMILRFAQQKNLEPTLPPKRPELTALMDRRTHLSDELAREKTRLQNSPKHIHASIARMSRHLKAELAKIEKAIKTLIDKDQSAHHAVDVMQQTTGVGPITAWAILAYLPEITQLSRNRVVAMAGLAPYNQDSGSHKGPRHICGGRHKVRNVLYMAAMVACSHNAIIKPYAQRCLERGKDKKWILTAVMRKLLIHLQRTLKNQQICLV